MSNVLAVTLRRKVRVGNEGRTVVRKLHMCQCGSRRGDMICDCGGAIPTDEELAIIKRLAGR